MTSTDLETRLLQLVRKTDYKPIKPRTLAKKLKLDDEQHRELKRLIKQLVKRGTLSYGSRHLVQLAKDLHQSHITGVFRRTKRGFGFVRPAGGTPDRAEDIYIPDKKSRDAASGDTVLVHLNSACNRLGKLRGEITEIIDRQTHQFVGTFDLSSGQGVVRVDGGIFGHPVFAGDNDAKNVQPGDKVVIEMVRFPSHVHDGECVITEILGQRGTPGVDTLSIIREYGLPDEFPEKVLESARHEAERFDESISSDRTDLTDLTVVTIDPFDARDFDDAISLERLDNRDWRLGVHIADVSHFVRPQSPLDREARDRATSVYLPDRVIPMLPEIISNNLASLQPDRVRYTKSVFIDFTAEGTRIHTETCAGAIRSQRRFTYEEVDDYLQNSARWKRKLKPNVHDLLGRMHELAAILRARRFQRGSLELSLRETKIDLDTNGQVCGAHLVENTESHQMIEEFMLAANEAVAEMLQDWEFLFLRRIHEPPAPPKLKDLTNFVRELGLDAHNLKNRFELQQVLDRVRGLPQAHAVNYAVLRSMQKAIYSPHQEGHYALASDCYCHFTSPIRRYPDLTVHRLLDAILHNKRPSQNLGHILIEGEHCSAREQRAEEAERELIKLKLLNYLSQRLGDEMDAVITGVEEFGIFAQGIDLPAEGLIHVNTLQDDHYRFDRTKHALIGYRKDNELRLGDRIRVAIGHVDIDRRQLDMNLVVSVAGKQFKQEKSEKKNRHGKKQRSSQDKSALKPNKRLQTTQNKRTKKKRKKNQGSGKK